MRANTHQGFSGITIPTQDLKPIRPTIDLQPIIKSASPNSPPMFNAVPVDVVNGKKHRLSFSTTGALSSICPQYHVLESQSPRVSLPLDYVYMVSPKNHLLQPTHSAHLVSRLHWATKASGTHVQVSSKGSAFLDISNNWVILGHGILHDHYTINRQWRKGG